MSFNSLQKSLLFSVAAGFLSSCGGGSDNQPAPVTPQSRTVRANVTGLTGVLVLQDTSGATLTLNSNGAHVVVSLNSGATYSISVGTQPKGQHCVVTNGAGVVASANVSNVDVACTDSFSTISGIVSFGPDVPPALVARITKIASSAQIVAPNAPLLIPTAQGGSGSILYGIDDDRNVLLAGIATSTTTELTAESTALVMVRVIFGGVPSSLTSAQYDSAVRQTAAFEDLVAAIEAADPASGSPLLSPNVMTNCFAVLSQLPEDVVNAQAETTSLPLARPRALAATPVTAIPHTLVSWSGGRYQSVLITGADSAGRVKVFNSMSVAWAAATSGPGSGSAFLPAAELKYQVAGGLSDSAANALATAVGGSGSSFNVTVSQNEVTRGANLVSAVRSGAKLAIQAVTAGTANALAGECQNQLIDILVPPNELSQLATQPSAQSAKNYLRSVGESARKGIGTLFEKCLGQSAAGSASNASGFTEITLGLLSGFASWVEGASSTVAAVAGAANAGLGLGQTFYYWDKTFSASVCVGSGGLLGPQIASCATTLILDPASPVLAPGATFLPNISARDTNNSPTLVPTDLTYSSSIPNIAKVDAATGLITALTAAPPLQPTITATSSSTGVSGNYPITVVVPSLTPVGALISVGSGDIITFKLTDAQGNPVILPPTAHWYLSDPKGTPTSPNLAPINYANGADVYTYVAALDGKGFSLWGASALAVDSDVMITVADELGNTYGHSNVHVSPPGPFTTSFVAAGIHDVLMPPGPTAPSGVPTIQCKTPISADVNIDFQLAQSPKATVTTTTTFNFLCTDDGATVTASVDVPLTRTAEGFGGTYKSGHTTVTLTATLTPGGATGSFDSSIEGNPIIWTPTGTPIPGSHDDFSLSGTFTAHKP